MKTAMQKILFGLALLSVAPLGAAEVVAVLSADSGPYKEALDGLKASVGDVESATLPALPNVKNAKVVVTFGGEAALKKYPASVALVAALLPDPGLKINHGGSLSRVGLPPAPALLLEKIKSLGGGTLGVLASPSYNAYVDALKEAAKSGQKVEVKKVADVGDLAAKLPSLKGAVNSLWLPPDPLFMNPKTFGLVVGFCKANGIKLIAPLPALVKAGATAGIAPSFKQQGSAAGDAAKAYVDGRNPGSWVYSNKTEFAKE